MRSIATYPLAALCGLAMVVSLFLKWVKVPDELLAAVSGLAAAAEGEAAAVLPEVQTSFGPKDLMDMGMTVETLFQDPVGIAVAASFLLAAAVAILGFLGGTVPRLFAILGGLVPFGIVGYLVFRARAETEQFQFISLPEELTSGGNIVEGLKAMTPYIDLGIYAYFGGAALLLLLGILSPAKKEAY